MALTFALTDPHGCLDLLTDLVSKCEFYALEHECVGPKYVLLGDYVDRGPDSAGVIRFVRNMQDCYGAIVLRGNHDQMMIDALIDGRDIDCWSWNGMRATVLSYGFRNGGYTRDIVETMRADPRVMEDAKWLAGLPLYHEDDLRVFVHAGIRPGVPMERQSQRDLLWIRDVFMSHRANTPKHVVHGHTILRDPEKPQYCSFNRTGLDSGGFAYGILTAGVFDDESAAPIDFLRSYREKAKDDDRQPFNDDF